MSLEKSSYTGAYRAWELVDEHMFNEPARQASWQYQVLAQLAKAEGQGWDAYHLALDAHHERGFFGYLARSTVKYVCGDAKIRREIKKAADDVRKSGITLTAASPDAVVGSAGLSLGILLVQHVPILGFVGAPVIAGFVLILYRIGIDAFCEWAQQEYRFPLELPTGSSNKIEPRNGSRLASIAFLYYRQKAIAQTLGNERKRPIYNHDGPC